MNPIMITIIVPTTITSRIIDDDTNKNKKKKLNQATNSSKMSIKLIIGLVHCYGDKNKKMNGAKRGKTF
jgi:hypothetical protein